MRTARSHHIRETDILDVVFGCNHRIRVKSMGLKERRGRVRQGELLKLLDVMGKLYQLTFTA